MHSMEQMFHLFLLYCVLYIVQCTLICLVSDVCICYVPPTRDANQILALWSLIVAEHKTVTNTDVIPD